jgi:hypothetical protein
MNLPSQFRHNKIAQIAIYLPTPLLNQLNLERYTQTKSVASTVLLSGMLRTDGGLRLKLKPRPEAGHRNPYLRGRWRWRDNGSKNGKKGRRRSRTKFPPVLGWTALVGVSMGNGTLTSGLDTPVVTDKIGVVRGLGLAEGKSSDLGRRLEGNDSSHVWFG